MVPRLKVCNYSSKVTGPGDDLAISEPTPLDALAFAYLHSILHSSDNVRIEVCRRANLVAWELKVRRLVSEGFAS
jgi:metaxin